MANIVSIKSLKHNTLITLHDYDGVWKVNSLALNVPYIQVVRYDNTDSVYKTITTRDVDKIVSNSSYGYEASIVVDSLLDI